MWFKEEEGDNLAILEGICDVDRRQSLVLGVLV